MPVHDDNIARETHKNTWLQRAREKPKVIKKDYKIKLEDSGQATLEQKEESTVYKPINTDGENKKGHPVCLWHKMSEKN